MKLLVLEKDDKITSIFRKIFSEKKYEVEFARNEFECLNKYDTTFDCVILENSRKFDTNLRVEDEIRTSNPEQKILFLSPYLGTTGETVGDDDTKNLIEKPFALLTLIAQLEIQGKNHIENY